MEAIDTYNEILITTIIHNDTLKKRLEIHPRRLYFITYNSTSDYEAL